MNLDQPIYLRTFGLHNIVRMEQMVGYRKINADPYCSDDYIVHTIVPSWVTRRMKYLYDTYDDSEKPIPANWDTLPGKPYVLVKYTDSFGEPMERIMLNEDGLTGFQS